MNIILVGAEEREPMPICTENVEVNRGKVAPWNLVVLTVLYTPTGKGREGKGSGVSKLGFRNFPCGCHL